MTASGSDNLNSNFSQDIIDGKTAAEMAPLIPELGRHSGRELEIKYSGVKEALTLLSSIARKWQTGRQAEGALNLESTEVQFEFEEKSMTDIRPKDHLEIHETVAEFMIMANHWVARKISDVFPSQSILRLHPPPNKENFQQLAVTAQSRGWTVQTGTNKALADSLDRCVDTQVRSGVRHLTY